MATIDRPSNFTSDAARDRFDAVYDDVLASLWPVPVRADDVPTAFGCVRVCRSGQPGQDPVVLVGGAGSSAVAWYRYVAVLARTRPVVAVDPLGEVGRSVQTEPIPDGRAAARWLTDVLDAVDARQAHVVASSYGGWTALQQQLHFPGRVSALTLLDPAGFGPLTRRFYRWIILGGMAGLLPAGLRSRAARRLINGTLNEQEMMRLVLASTKFRRRLPPATEFSDEQLAVIRPPVQLLLGARSTLHDADAVAERVLAAAPAWRVEIVPDTGHALPIEAPDLILERILTFPPIPVPAAAPAHQSSGHPAGARAPRHAAS